MAPTKKTFVLAVAAILVFLFPYTVKSRGATKAQMYDLYNDLFNVSVYNKYVRPVDNTSTELEVFMTFSLISLVDINERSQVLKSYAMLGMDWTDYQLSWDTAFYGGVDTVTTQQEHIWVPDLMVANSVVEQKEFGYKTLPVRVFSDGLIYWNPTTLLETSCTIDVTYYPFDTQKCQIQITTVQSYFEEINVKIDPLNSVETYFYSEDGSWSLQDISAVKVENEMGKSFVTISLLLSRRTKFFVVNLIMPVLFLSMTASLVFVLPVDSGEKMGTSITVLLAYAVYLTIVTDLLPATSLQTCTLSMYLTMVLGFTACSVVIEVFVIRIHFKPEDQKVGKRWRRVKQVLDTITCHGKKPGWFRRPRDSTTVTPINNKDRKPSFQEHDPEIRDIQMVPVTWKEIATSIDWFFFILFNSLVILTTVVCLCIMIIGGSVNAPSL